MKHFFSLIDRLNSHPNEQAQITAEIWQLYGVDKAVLALDMSGFSSSTRREGIISYLAKIRKMHTLSKPLVHQYHGEVIKYEADNLLAVFDDCQQALNAACAIREACVETGVSIGIDYGQVLVIPNKDCYGDTVNIAFKLGEDIAQQHEILITHAVKERISPHLALIQQEISISGLTFIAYQVLSHHKV